MSRISHEVPRTRPLVLAGPSGTEIRLRLTRTQESLEQQHIRFPDESRQVPRAPVRF